MRIIQAGVVLAWALSVSLANAAGLGKLTVHSALGQPLNAEIDLVSVQPGELEDLTARVAPPEAFRDARIEFSNSLRLLRFAVDKRANGQPYIKITSVGPINEPFVDALIELSWRQGRIQREYPILLDPPGYAQGRVAPPTTAAAPTTPPAPAPAVSSSTPTPAPGAATSEPGTAPSAQREMPSTATPAPVESTAGGDTYGPVQKGDTLAKIATELKPSNVSLEQMLVALYRENKSAFVNNNMNRLKAGQILKVPSATEVEQVEAKEARTEYKTHVADWRAYRESLGTAVAATAPRTDTSPASSGGRIGTAAVTPPPAPTEAPKDVLKLSKTEAKAGKATPGKGGAGATQERLNALQEELTAKDKALQEANSRVADLEKQIRDMQRLIDLKGTAPGKADTKTATAPAVPAPTKAPEPPKVAEAPKPAPAAPAKVEPAKVEPAKPAEPPKVAQATPTPTPAPTATPAPAPKADAAKPADPSKPAAKPAPKKPAPAPAKSFTDELLDNPLVFWGGIGLLALAIGGGAFAFIRRRRAQDVGGSSSQMGSAFPADLKVDQPGGKPGGGLVDTGNSSFLTDFDKTGPGTIDTDEVDPVAEAEVYIAYGRDAQAEEILKEAMARDPNRPEIAVKLLEIYHARKSATAFESVAKDLHARVGDTHPLWQKAAAMGAQIDPRNPLYAAATAGGAAALVAAAAEPAAKPQLDFDIAGSKTGEPAAAAPDFNLDADTSKPAESSGLDFDIAPSQPAPAAAEPAKEEKPSFDFDLSGLEMGGSKGASPSTDLDLEASRPAPSAPALNLSDLSLEPAAESSGDSGGGEGVGTKLELAKAYLEIGDKDGARDILQEVAREGSAEQKAEAEKLISQL